VERVPDRDRYAYKDTVQLTAISNSGYSFTNWSGDTTGTDNVMILVVDTAVTNLTAHFAENSETVTVPDVPTGPDTGIMGVPLTFSTGGSVSNFGNDVQYQFDWGDGSLSDWNGENGVHSYLSTGVKSVRARARSAVTTSIVSDWSQAHDVTIDGYALVVTIDPPGTGQVDADPAKALYAQDEVVQLTATAMAGYLFDSWSGDAVGAENPLSLTMDSDKNVTAHFIQAPTYTLTINIDPAGSGTVAKFPDKVEYDAGDTVMVTAAPADGFSFTGWSGDLSGSLNPAQIIMDGNKTVTATFSQDPKYTLTLMVDPIGGGTVAKNPDLPAYDPGDTVTVTATPADGFSFTGWSGDLSGSLNPAEIVMDGNKTVTANFAQIPKYTLTVTIDPVGGGTVNKAPDKMEYDAEETVTLTAVPSAGYTFSGWDGDAAGMSNPVDIVMNGNKNVTAQFVSDASFVLMININPPDGGTVIKVPDKRGYEMNELVTLTAEPANGYLFDSWSGDLSGSINPEQLTMDGDKVVNVLFVAVSDTVTLPSKPTGPVRGYRGEPITLSTSNAVSSLGHDVEYQFDRGDGTLSDWGDPTQTYAWSTLGNFTYRARARSSVDSTAVSDWSESSTIFISSCHILVASDPGNAGEVLIDPYKSDYDYGEVVILTGKANSGYQFSHWNDDLNDSLYTKTVTMDRDKTFVAHFEVKTSVEDRDAPLANGYVLEQNYPNPFNPETMIRFQIAESEFVSLTVYNMKGEHVHTLVNGMLNRGQHTILWRADDTMGNQVPSGIYFYCLKTGTFNQTKKMILMR
jgi:uncharacterized repeat protein (TIGR02543 family)